MSEQEVSLWTRLRNWWSRPDTGDRLIGPIPRDVWEPAAATAKARGDNLRDVAVRALREYGREGQ